MYRTLITAILGSLIVGCGPQFSAQPGNPGLTGGLNPQGLGYTRTILPNQEPDELDLAQQPTEELTESAKQQLKRNRTLGQSIHGMDWKKFDKNGKPTANHPNSFEITIKISKYGLKKEVFFKGNFQPTGQTLSINPTTSKNDPNYKISGSCTDLNCNTKMKLRLEFNNNKENPPYFAFTHLNGQGYLAKAKLREDQTAKLSDRQKAQLQNYKNIQYAWFTEWWIDNGPSFYSVTTYKTNKNSKEENNTRITVLSPNDVPEYVRIQEKEKDQDVQVSQSITLSGEALQTRENDISVQVISSRTEKPQSVRLIGNGEDTPLNTFEVTLAPENDKEESLDFVLEFESVDERPSSPTDLHGFRGVSPESHFRANVDDNHPRTQLMIDDFERNYGIRGVNNYIDEFVSGSWRNRFEQFVYTSKPFKKHIEKIYAAYDAPAPLAYIFLNESRYFTTGKDQYKIQRASSSSSSALGPGQFIQATARSMKMTVNNQYDERKYFIPSACAAARYYGWLKSTNELQGKDSAMTILAYKLGSRGIGNVFQCLNQKNPKSCWELAFNKISRKKKPGTSQKYGFTQKEKDWAMNALRKYNFTFKEVVNRHMLDDENAGYMFRFFALYFLGGSPSEHGLNIDAIGGETKLPENAFGPKAPNDPVCRELYAHKYSI